MLKKKIYYALMIFNALVFVASMAYIVNYLFDSSKEGNEYDELINLKESIQAAMPSTSPTEMSLAVYSYACPAGVTPPSGLCRGTSR